MKQTLYNIAANIRLALDDNESGEIDGVALDRLDQLGLDLAAKVEAVALVVRERTARAAALKEQQELFGKAHQVEQNNVARLKDYLMQCLDLAGVPKVDTQLVKVRVQNNSKPTVTVENMDALPEWAIAEKLIQSPNRDEILKRLADDPALELPCGVKVEMGRHVRIW